VKGKAVTADHSATKTCLDEVDHRLGFARRPYALAFWAFSVFSTSVTFNIYSRTQQWGFNLPFAPDFEGVGTTYGVAAFGGFGGGALFLIVLSMLYVYADQWGRCYNSWVGRVPSFSAEIKSSAAGTFLPIIHGAALAIIVGVPLVGQAHFVDKFLAGLSTMTTTGAVHARNWKDHLFQWVAPWECTDFVYDGRQHFAYCELYEPWALVVFAAAIFVVAGAVIFSVFRPRTY
jgi:hypothetical protein